MKRILNFFRRNLLLKIVSLMFAVAFWIFVTVGQPDAEAPRTVTLILVNLPDNMVRISDVISHLEITIGGSRNVIRNIQNEDLFYELDMSKISAGPTTFKIIPSRIKGLTSAINVTSISPTQVTVVLADRANRIVPVSITLKGKPAEGYGLGEKMADPALVEVTGAVEEVDRLKFVPTEQVDITGRRAGIKKTVGLDLAGQHIDLVQYKEVEVKVEILPRIITRKFEEIPILVINTIYEAQVTPGALDFNLQGPEAMVSKLDPKDVRLIVDATGLDVGTEKIRPKIQLPDNTVVVQDDMAEVQITLKKVKPKTISKKKKKN